MTGQYWNATRRSANFMCASAHVPKKVDNAVRAPADILEIICTTNHVGQIPRRRHGSEKSTKVPKAPSPTQQSRKYPFLRGARPAIEPGFNILRSPGLFEPFDAWVPIRRYDDLTFSGAR
jgi:hypothetical protein